MSLALALARHGLASRILERRAVLAEAGAGIQLGPNAMHVLSRLGVAERLEPMAGCPQSIEVYEGASGRRLASLPLGAHMEARHGAPYRVAHRADLQAALLAAVGDAPVVALETGFEVESWYEPGDGIEARTRSGDARSGSMLVGADGLWSAVRRRLHPGHPLTYSGKMAARTVVSAASAQAPFNAPSTGVWLGRDAHVVHYPVRAGREIAVVAIIDEARAREGWGGEIDREVVLARLAAFASTVRGVLALGLDWRVWSLYDPPPLPAWSSGRVALIGDAAHPVLPFLAQGGALAIEDAETLAAAIAAAPGDAAGAFQAYEAARRARVVRAQDAARRNGRIYHLSGLAGLARDLVLAAVPGHVVMRQYDWLYGWKGDALPASTRAKQR